LANPNDDFAILDDSVVYIKQDGATWVQQVVASPDPSVPRYCGEPYEGATCSLDYYSFVPLGVATSGSGDVRLIYARHRHITEQEAECVTGGPGGGFCEWSGSSTSMGSVHLAWEEGAGLNSVQVASGFSAYGADMEIDAEGDMHLAFYAITDSLPSSTTSTDPEVRYLRIGSDD
jgi:hypothetical protein